MDCGNSTLTCDSCTHIDRYGGYCGFQSSGSFSWGFVSSCVTPPSPVDSDAQVLSVRIVYYILGLVFALSFFNWQFLMTAIS